MLSSYQFATGSVIGTGHREALKEKNGHDALHAEPCGQTCFGEAIALLVADGCGSQPHSEVGAKIGSRLVCEAIRRQLQRWQRTADHPRIQFMAILERARHDVLARLRILAQEMGGSFSATVNEYFLFTLVGAVVTDEFAVFFHLGDGLIVLNGEEIWLEPEAGNEPIYLSYAMVETSLAARPDMLRFQIVRVVATDRLESFLIGSDGLRDLANAATKSIPGQTAAVGPLSQFWTDDAFFRNKDKVRRRLALINQTNAIPNWDARVLGQELGHLKDDTTLIVGRRTP